MKCNQFKKQIWNYLDGRADEFQAHVNECPQCRKTVKNAEKLLTILKERAAPAPPAAYCESFWPRVKKKIRNQDSLPRPFSILKMNPIYYAGMSAAAAALIIWVLIQESDSTVMTGSPAEPRDYIMATAAKHRTSGKPDVNYICPPGGNYGGEKEGKIDYILPGPVNGDPTSWAV
jgi:hypothetical protein